MKLSQDPNPEIVSNYPRGIQPVPFTSELLEELVKARPAPIFVFMESLCAAMCLYMAIYSFRWPTVIIGCVFTFIAWTHIGKSIKLVGYVRRWPIKSLFCAQWTSVILSALGLGFFIAIVLRRDTNRILAEAGVDRWGIEGNQAVWEESLAKWSESQIVQEAE